MRIKNILKTTCDKSSLFLSGSGPGPNPYPFDKNIRGAPLISNLLFKSMIHEQQSKLLKEIKKQMRLGAMGRAATAKQRQGQTV